MDNTRDSPSLSTPLTRERSTSTLSRIHPSCLSSSSTKTPTMSTSHNIEGATSSQASLSNNTTLRPRRLLAPAQADYMAASRSGRRRSIKYNGASTPRYRFMVTVPPSPPEYCQQPQAAFNAYVASPEFVATDLTLGKDQTPPLEDSIKPPAPVNTVASSASTEPVESSAFLDPTASTTPNNTINSPGPDFPPLQQTHRELYQPTPTRRSSILNSDSEAAALYDSMVREQQQQELILPAQHHSLPQSYGPPVPPPRYGVLPQYHRQLYGSTGAIIPQASDTSDLDTYRVDKEIQAMQAAGSPIPHGHDHKRQRSRRQQGSRLRQGTASTTDLGAYFPVESHNYQNGTPPSTESQMLANKTFTPRPNPGHRQSKSTSSNSNRHHRPSHSRSSTGYTSSHENQSLAQAPVQVEFQPRVQPRAQQGGFSNPPSGKQAPQSHHQQSFLALYPYSIPHPQGVLSHSQQAGFFPPPSQLHWLQAQRQQFDYYHSPLPHVELGPSQQFGDYPHPPLPHLPQGQSKQFNIYPQPTPGDIQPLPYQPGFVPPSYNPQGLDSFVTPEFCRPHLVAQAPTPPPMPFNFARLSVQSGDPIGKWDDYDDEFDPIRPREVISTSQEFAFNKSPPSPLRCPDLQRPHLTGRARPVSRARRPSPTEEEEELEKSKAEATKHVTAEILRNGKTQVQRQDRYEQGELIVKNYLQVKYPVLHSKLLSTIKKSQFTVDKLYMDHLQHIRRIFNNTLRKIKDCEDEEDLKELMDAMDYLIEQVEVEFTNKLKQQMDSTLEQVLEGTGGAIWTTQEVEMCVNVAAFGGVELLDLPPYLARYL